MLNKYEVVKFYCSLGASSSSLADEAKSSVGDKSPNDKSKPCLRNNK